jgi:hypothetical protein
MKSGGGVLVVAAAQLLVGLCILGIYEGECRSGTFFLSILTTYLAHTGYKAYFYNTFLLERSTEASDDQEPIAAQGYEDPLDPWLGRGDGGLLERMGNASKAFGSVPHAFMCLGLQVLNLSSHSPMHVCRSPMGASYYISIVNNIFAVMGLAGILNAQVGPSVRLHRQAYRPKSWPVSLGGVLTSIPSL